MRIEFAPPGTDPTCMPGGHTHADNKLGEFVHHNGLLIIAVVALAVFSAQRAGLFESQTIPEQTEPVADVVAVLPTAVPAPAVDPAFCLYLDAILIPDGNSVNVGGTQLVTCHAGEVVVVAIEAVP